MLMFRKVPVTQRRDEFLAWDWLISCSRERPFCKALLMNRIENELG